MDLVRAGEWDFSAINEEHPYQDRTIAHVSNIDQTDPDSVQLIFVTEPFVLSLNIRTVCLPLPETSSALSDTSECTTAAWGQQNCSGLKGLHSVLGRAELSTDTHRSACEDDWQEYLEDKTFRLKTNQFCTKRKHSIDDSCFCDHGAALFCTIQPSAEMKRYEQIGVSIATGGCTKDLPGMAKHLLKYSSFMIYSQETMLFLFRFFLFSYALYVFHSAGIFSSVSEQRASIDEIFAQKGLDSSYYTI